VRAFGSTAVLSEGVFVGLAVGESDGDGLAVGEGREAATEGVKVGGAEGADETGVGCVWCSQSLPIAPPTATLASDSGKTHQIRRLRNETRLFPVIGLNKYLQKDYGWQIADFAIPSNFYEREVEM
jgi:hypothetical protein